MKRILVGVFFILCLLVVGCSPNKPASSDDIQPLVIHIMNTDIIVDDAEKAAKVNELIESIEWKQIEATFSRDPDFEFYLLPRGVDSKLANWYQIWFNESGAEIFQIGDKLFGKVSPSNAKLLQDILNSGEEKGN